MFVFFKQKTAYEMRISYWSSDVALPIVPSVLMMRDIIGIAQTGTGKTASFVLPMIDILAHGRARARMPRSLILAPTRELAAQVAENFEKYGKYHKLSMALLIGGVQMGDQVKALEKIGIASCRDRVCQYV